MARSGSVPLLLLPLLLASAVANVYQQLASVTNPVENRESPPASTDSDCADSCSALRRCSGYVFNGGKCTLYIQDCRGPVQNGQAAPTNYLAKHTCPDAACACPGEFTRYGTRCLQLLDKLESDWMAAQIACFALGANLAVPRLQAEHNQTNLAAAGARTKVWLGLSHLPYQGIFAENDACGDVTQVFWASGEPASDGGVAHSPPALAGNTGWSVEGWQPPADGPYHPLCQLDYCYRPDCSA